MSTPTTIGEIVARIEAVHAQFADALALLSDVRLQAARLPGGRSGKDVLAHLTFWDQRLLHAIVPQAGAHACRLAPPLIADSPYNDQWADVVNERIFHINRGRDIATIKEEFARTCGELRQAVGALTERDVFDPNGLAALLGEPCLPLLTGAYEHYADHVADLQKSVVSQGERSAACEIAAGDSFASLGPWRMHSRR